MEQAQENAERIADKAASTVAGANGGSADVTAAYERARREVQDAIARLRTEINRIDFEQARIQARDWVRSNPEFATVLAVGAGMLLGRLVGATMKPEPPPTFTKRLRHGAGSFAAQAQRLAEEVGETILDGAGHASEKFSRTARVAGHQVQEMGSDLTRRAGIAAAAAARGATEIGEELAERARTYGGPAAKSAKRAAKKNAGRSVDYAESALDAARTLVAATLIKRVNSWLKNAR